MPLWSSICAFFAFCLLLFAGPADAQAQQVHPAADKADCPDASKSVKPDEITLQSGRIELQDYHAHIDVPAELRFIGTEEARAYAYHEYKWSKCIVGKLVGFFVSPKNWQYRGNPDYPDSRMIGVYYHPTYVSPSDVLTTDYDEIAQQVRESYYDREQAEYHERGAAIYRHVMGWAIRPEYDPANASMIWSLHIAEGDTPDYGVLIHMAKFGRKGYFSLQMHGMISQNKANGEIMRKAGNAITFAPGWTHAERSAQNDFGKTVSIGNLVAESVNARRATPLTWGEYFQLLGNWLLKLVLHYAVELLVFATFVVGAAFISSLRRRWRSPDEDENFYELAPSDQNWPDWRSDKMPILHDPRFDRLQSRNLTVLLNGSPLNHI